MPTSRRSLLRNSALLAGGAAIGAASDHFAEKRKQKATKKLTGIRSSADATNAFVSGIRIFFAGSWLFCPDPYKAAGGMLAIGRDMDTDCKAPHIFPYGQWDETNGIDGMKTPLQPNSLSNPHKVDITYRTPPTHVAKLSTVMQDAVNKNPCTYLRSKNYKDVAINLKNKDGIRVISLPTPSRILPATFRPWSLVYYDKTKIPVMSPDGTQPGYPALGVPTVYIFEYPYAVQLDFTEGITGRQSKPTTGSNTSSGDFHFHVLPDPSQPGVMDHGPAMFKRLVDLLTIGNTSIDPNDFQLLVPSNQTEDDLDLLRGPDVPLNNDQSYVSDYELGVGIVSIDKASCTGGGILSGDCPDGTC